jgi:hypothetical protein
MNLRKRKTETCRANGILKIRVMTSIACSEKTDKRKLFCFQFIC